jgi:DNA-binding XRE family transcriptional regulator
MMGETIFRLRKEKGLSQGELGKLIGVSNKAVSKWETYEANPDVTLLPLLAQSLGVSIDELFTDIIVPKDNKEYWEDKKNTILDVVENICKKKPLYKLTMKEIIIKTGLNSGTVFALFSDIDDVIIALINRMNISFDCVGTVNKILQGEKTPEEKIEALINYTIEFIHSSVNDYGKIVFEMNVILTDVVRREKIAKAVPALQVCDCVGKALFDVIEESINNCYFKPVFSKESIFVILTSFIDGFFRNLTFNKHYQVNMPQIFNLEKNDLSKTLTDSIIYLLKNQKTK